MWLAAALSAGALVLAVHAFTVELLGDRRVALVAAGVVAASPIVLLHSAPDARLPVGRPRCSQDSEAATRSARLWVVCGALLGLMLLARPLDGVIAGSALVAGVASSVAPCGRPARSGGVAWVTLGFIPWLVLALLFNLRTTGSLTEFPLMASDPRNTFGFGDAGCRSARRHHYDLQEAGNALQTNLQAGIGWVFGGAVVRARAVALSAKRGSEVVAPRALRSHLRPTSSGGRHRSPPTAKNGIGPHYYVMSLVPVAVLAADGFTRIARRHRALAVVVAVLAVGATAWNLPDKIDTARFPTDVYEPLHETLDVALDDAVVFVASDDVERFTNFRYPFLRNPPGLDGPVLYAADRHAENASLIDRSGRTGYLAHREISPATTSSPPTGCSPH